MIALIVGSTLLGGLLVGWYGHRTLVRIQHWGEKMNEIDAIYQSVAAPEEMAVLSGTPQVSETPVASASRAPRRHAQFGSGVPHGNI